MIDGIIEAVSIPVMAKARIGHFAEAQVLQSPRRRLHRRVRGAHPGRLRQPHRQVGVHRAVRLRRDQPRRGAAPDHRGRGDDPLQGRGRHRRRLQRGHAHAHHPAASCAGCTAWPRTSCTSPPRSCRRPTSWSRRSPAAGKLPVVLFTAGGIATPADAAMMMQLGAEGVFVGLRHLQVRQPGPARRGDRQGHHVLRRPRRGRQGLARPRRGDGRHQRRRDPAAAPARRARLVTEPKPTIGVLALQGDVREHLAVLADARRATPVAVRRPAELAAVRRAGHPGRGVDDDGQARQDLRPARAAARRRIAAGCRPSGPAPG